MAVTGISLLTLSARDAAAQGVTVSGVGYAQYAYLLSDTAGHGNNFDLTRAYLNFIGRFDGGLGTRVTGDIYRNADGSLAYRIKYAFATYTPTGSGLTYKLGVIHTPWLDWEETLWDYRMQGTMPIERNGYASSADLGAGVDGTFNHDAVNFQVALVNGEFYSRAPGDKRKDLQGRFSVRLAPTDDSSRVGGVRLTFYGGYGAPTGGGQRHRVIGMLSYRSRTLTLAAQGALTRDSVAPPPLTAGAPAWLASGYGVYKFPRSKLAAVARLDLNDPNKNLGGDRRTRLIAGLSYQLNPHLRLLGDWDYLNYQTTPTPAQQVTRSQALFQVQFNF